MLDIKLIRENPDFVRQRLATRGAGDEKYIEEVVQLDEDGKPFTALATTRGDLLDMDVLYHDSEQPLITLATKRVYTQIGRLQMLGSDTHNTLET